MHTEDKQLLDYLTHIFKYAKQVYVSYIMYIISVSSFQACGVYKSQKSLSELPLITYEGVCYQCPLSENQVTLCDKCKTSLVRIDSDLLEMLEETFWSRLQPDVSANFSFTPFEIWFKYERSGRWYTVATLIE